MRLELEIKFSIDDVVKFEEPIVIENCTKSLLKRVLLEACNATQDELKRIIDQEMV